MGINPKYPVIQIYPGTERESEAAHWDSRTKRSVVEYLADESFHKICSTGMLSIDSRTKETLPWYGDTMVDDDGFYWLITLPYYIQKYGWMLPQSFVDHVEKRRASGWVPTKLISEFDLD